MNKLTFKIDDTLKRLVAQAMAGKEWSVPYMGKTQSDQPTLCLVGDHGVYVMSNVPKGMPVEEGKPRQVVCYAEGINPDKDEFDDWWSLKCAVSRDDFANAIPAEWFDQAIKDGAPEIILEIGAKQIKARWKKLKR